jgi:hypothetical protein
MNRYDEVRTDLIDILQARGLQTPAFTRRCTEG